MTTAAHRLGDLGHKISVLHVPTAVPVLRRATLVIYLKRTLVIIVIIVLIIIVLYKLFIMSCRMNS